MGGPRISCGVSRRELIVRAMLHGAACLSCRPAWSTDATVYPFRPDKLDLEVWYQLRLHYVNEAFGAMGREAFFAYRDARMREAPVLSDEEALERARVLVQQLEDPYTFIVDASEYERRSRRLATMRPGDSGASAASDGAPSGLLGAQAVPIAARRTVVWRVFSSTRGGRHQGTQWQSAAISGGKQMPSGSARGYLRIESFGGGTVDEIRRALVAMREAGAADLVVDLRGNLGGSALAAEQAVGLFAPNTARPLLVERTVEGGLLGAGKQVPPEGETLMPHADDEPDYKLDHGGGLRRSATDGGGGCRG